MNLQQEASGQILQTSVLLLIEGSKLLLHVIGSGAERITALLTALASQQNRTRGAVRLSTLLRSGTGLEVYTIQPEQLKTWAQMAKQYSVPYTIVKGNRLEDGMLDIFIRPEDAARVNRMCERAHLTLTPEATVSSREATEQEIQAAQEANTEMPGVEAVMELDTDSLIDRILADDAVQLTDHILENPEQDAAFDALFEAPPETVQPERTILEQADFTIMPVLEPGQFVIEEVPDNDGLAEETDGHGSPPAEEEKQETPSPTPALPEESPSPQPSGRKPDAGQSLNGPSKPSAEQGEKNEWSFQRVNEEWPLSHPKEAFTMAQRMEIHRAFSDGLSPEVVNKLAQPQFSPQTMSFLRESRDAKLMDAFAYNMRAAEGSIAQRPSVMKQLIEIRTEQEMSTEQAVPSMEPAPVPEA